MTYTIRHYQSYQEYSDDDQLQPEHDYRLLSTGELIEVSGKDDGNLWLTSYLFALLLKVHGFSFFELVRKGNKELQKSSVLGVNLAIATCVTMSGSISNMKSGKFLSLGLLIRIENRSRF